MSTDNNQDFNQAPGAGFQPDDLQSSNQGGDSGYGQMADSQNDQGMGGGYGAHGSGVAGGYEGNQDSSQTSQNPTSQSQQAPAQGAEKQDWLDKGIEMVGKKFGHNVSDSNADKAGDFINKETKQYGGRNLPGVQ